MKTSWFKSIAAAMVFAAAGVLPAVAEMGDNYISECAMYYSSNNDADARKNLTNAGWDPVGINFNCGDGHHFSKWILMGVHRTTNPDKAIRAFAIYDGGKNKSVPDTFVRDGITFYKIGSGCVDWCPHVLDGAVDLNMGASGNFMYIFATRDPKAGPPITRFEMAAAKPLARAVDGVSAKGCVPILDQNGFVADCNKGTGGDFLVAGYARRGYNFKYREPEYNVAGDAKSGIKSWSDKTLPFGTMLGNGMTVLSTDTYIVGMNTHIPSRLTCNGNVKLFLADGVTLTAKEGITVMDGNSLTIYGGEDGTGKLVAEGPHLFAGIGSAYDYDRLFAGSKITINGGTVVAKGGGRAAAIGGAFKSAGTDIVINGGTVKATGNEGGSAIGGGEDGIGENIVINGGEVTAQAGWHDSAGIGGGTHRPGRKITINGGEVRANGGLWAAGIGGGGMDGGSASHGGDGEDITINGGTVVTQGGGSGAGIGGGYCANGRRITINGGDVTAIGGGADPVYFNSAAAAGIGGGGGYCGGGYDITITGGTVTARGGRHAFEPAAGIGGGYSGSLKGLTISGGTVVATGSYPTFIGRGSGGIGGGCTGHKVFDINITGGTVMAVGMGAGIGTHRGAITNLHVSTQYAVLAADLSMEDVPFATYGALEDVFRAKIQEDPSCLTVIENKGQDLGSAVRGHSCIIIHPTNAQIGDNVQANFEGDSCTISGEGDVWSDEENRTTDCPFGDMLMAHRGIIRRLVIGDGVTSIGERFSGFTALTNVEVSASVRNIGAGVFAGCKALKRLAFGAPQDAMTFGEKAIEYETRIEMNGGVPVLTTEPEITFAGERPTLMGTKSLLNPKWEVVEEGHEEEFNFFKFEIR